MDTMISGGSRPNPCNVFYESGIDTVYLPGMRELQSINNFFSSATFQLDALPEPCR